MRPIVIRLCAVLILLIISGSVCHAQRAPVKVIEGQVTDSITNAPLANVTITFEATGYSAGKVRTIRTDKNGNFRVRLPDRYFWNMKVESPGYATYVVQQVNGLRVQRRLTLAIRLKTG